MATWGGKIGGDTKGGGGIGDKSSSDNAADLENSVTHARR